LNPDFRIKPDPDPDVCRIRLKMLWIHSRCCRREAFRQVSLYHTNRPVNPIFSNGKETEKVIRNPQADPDQHQKLSSPRGSPITYAYRVWLMFGTAFMSYAVYRTTVRQNDHSTTPAWRSNTNKKLCKTRYPYIGCSINKVLSNGDA